MSTSQLLEALGGRSIAGTTDVVGGVICGPIEVVSARDGSDAGLRRAWRERKKGRATPLLAVHDAGLAGILRVLGPIDDRSPIREVPADRLADLLQRTSVMSKLLASREVSEELQRLDTAGTPGITVKDLLTRHLVLIRLRSTAQWADLRRSVENLPDGPDWRSLLTSLGFTLERRKQRGWLCRAAGRPLLVVHPLSDAAAFTRLDSSGRPPEGALALDCYKEGIRYGALASGSRMRLFRAGADAEQGPAATTSYLEIDAAELRAEDRPLLALLGPDALEPGGIFDRLVTESKRFGAELRGRLDEEIRTKVLPGLARGLGKWATGQGRDLADPKVRRDIENASLTWVFRALFVLYAESAGYLPVDQPAYQPTALTTLGGRLRTPWTRSTQSRRACGTGSASWCVPCALVTQP